MPVYRYECGSCGRVFEKLFLSFAEADLKSTECPACKAAAHRTYARHTFAMPGISSRGELAEDGEPYKEMHYHEKRGEWEQAAKAAEGVSEFARKKFLEKAQEKAKPGDSK